jgi:putative transposase
MSAPDLSMVSAGEWDRARRYLPIIQRLAKNPLRSRDDAVAAAAELGCSPAHVYTLLRRYVFDPRLTSLLPRSRGPARGTSLLDDALDEMIDSLIDSVYLTRQRPQIKVLVEEIKRQCASRGLAAPGRKAITARIHARPRQDIVARRHGRKAARDRFAPVAGSLKIDQPLLMVQIDHTLVDVIVVDSLTRKPIRRPWLTLAIDVCTRCVTGFHLSLEPPSATSVALCLSHSVLSKDGWLAQRDIDAVWPVFGIPATLHLDNAKEFRSEALKRGCEQYGIAIHHRPVRTPHYGGHIERLIGTMMGKVHLLPGTTFSNVQEKGDINPEKTAAMTLAEVERWLGHAIAGVYHRELHRGIGTTPLAAWERGISGDGITPGRGEPAAVADPRRFLIDFLPIERRKIRRDGIRLHNITYWADVLSTWIGQPDEVIIRCDPRDLSRIYLLAPDGIYYDIGYRDLGLPPISLWEQRLAVKRLREEGRLQIDEAGIFRTIEKMRAITADAVHTSKVARRQHERRLQNQHAAPKSTVPEADRPVRTREAGESLPPYKRMFPVEEW